MEALWRPIQTWMARLTTWLRACFYHTRVWDTLRHQDTWQPALHSTEWKNIFGSHQSSRLQVAI